MKTKLLLIFILIILNVSAQQQAPPVPETWETDVWFDAEWKHISTVDYTFNTDCLPVYALLQTLDFTTDMFVNSTQLDISYNNNSQMTTSTNQLWDINLQDWVNDRRTDFSYTGNNLTLIEIYIWENNAWQISETIQNTYDVNDLLAEALFQEWNVNSGSLINREKNDYTYTTSPQINTIVNSTWDNANSIWVNNTRLTYVYDSNDKVSSEIFQSWDTTGWINNNLEDYTYDSNDFLIESLKSEWNTTTEIYDPNQRKFYTNNSDGNQITVVDQTYIFGTWTNTTRDRRTYPSCETLNIEEVISSNYEAYPNPVKDQLTIKKQTNTNAVITLIDSNGRSILIQNVSNRINKLDVLGLKPGFYVLKISEDNKTVTKKLIKQ